MVGLVLAVARRVRVFRRRDRVLTADPPIEAVGYSLTTADIAENLGSSAIRLALGVVERTRSLGSRLLDRPLVAVSNDMTTLMTHLGTSIQDQNICSFQNSAPRRRHSTGRGAIPAKKLKVGIWHARRS